MARTIGDDPRAEAFLQLGQRLGFWIEAIGDSHEIVFSGPKKRKMRVDATLCEVEMWKLLVELRERLNELAR